MSRRPREIVEKSGVQAVVLGEPGFTRTGVQSRASPCSPAHWTKNVPAAWATADEFYGGDRILRRDLQTKGVGYVLAVAKSHRVILPIGVLRADQAADRLHRRCWSRLSAGQGAGGERDYDWALLRITPPADEAAGHHWLLVRGRISDGELACSRCWSPKRSPWPSLVRVASIRCSIEECFQASRGGVGPDQHQVRNGTPGTATPPSSCSPTRCSPSSPPTNANTTQKTTTD